MLKLILSIKKAMILDKNNSLKNDYSYSWRVELMQHKEYSLSMTNNNYRVLKPTVSYGHCTLYYLLLLYSLLLFIVAHPSLKATLDGLASTEARGAMFVAMPINQMTFIC